MATTGPVMPRNHDSALGVKVAGGGQPDELWAELEKASCPWELWRD